MDLKAGKVYATITHKRNKNKQESSKPKFSFSAIVSGFLVSTTIFSTAVAMPTYAAGGLKLVDDGTSITLQSDRTQPSDSFVVGNTKVTFGENGELYYSQTRNYTEALDTAVNATQQFAQLVNSGKVDLISIKKTIDSLREAEQLFNESGRGTLTAQDSEALGMIIKTYSSSLLEDVPTYAGGISDSRADLLSSVTITAMNFLQTNNGALGKGADLIKSMKESTNVASTTPSMLNFKASANGTKQYPDVPQDAWYAEEVTQSSSLGIIVGDDDGNFNPTDNLTYAEALTLAVRVNAIYYGRQSEAEELAAELKSIGSHWAKGYEDYAFKYNMLDANSYGRRNLDAHCTRYVMAELFAKALPIAEYTVINSWSKSPNQNEKNANVKLLFFAGIMVGDENGFRGGDPITRAEAACIINRVAVKDNRQKLKTTGHGSGLLIEQPPIDTPTVEQPPVVDTQFDYNAYNKPEIRTYIEALRTDPKYGNGAPAANGISTADVVQGKMASDLGINTYSTKNVDLENVSAGDRIVLYGGPNNLKAYTVLVIERQKDYVTTISFNRGGKVVWDVKYTLDQLQTEYSQVKVRRCY